MRMKQTITWLTVILSFKKKWQKSVGWVSACEQLWRIWTIMNNYLYSSTVTAISVYQRHFAFISPSLVNVRSPIHQMCVFWAEQILQWRSTFLLNLPALHNSTAHFMNPSVARNAHNRCATVLWTLHGWIHEYKASSLQLIGNSMTFFFSVFSVRPLILCPASISATLPSANHLFLQQNKIICLMWLYWLNR